MYIVTGGAGFIGSNLVHELNGAGVTDILVVDNLADARKARNLDGARFTASMDKHEFRRAIAANSLGLSKAEAVFHQGACADTLVDDHAYMMDNNFTYSKEVLAYAIRAAAPLVYASSAAVYGLSGPGGFAPIPENERPLNVYGASKLAFDNYLREQFRLRRVPTTAVSLRYFNAYGPREQHKGRMASVIHRFSKEILETGRVRLFEGSGGYPPGEQRRDFVYVRDLCRLNLFFAGVGVPPGERRTYHAIVNVGTGESRSFNEVARALIQVHGEVPIEYIPFPQDLDTRYQHFTEADLKALRETGCDFQFTSLEQGVRSTFDALAVANQ